VKVAQVHNTSRTDLITKFFGSYSIYKDEGNRKKERKKKKNCSETSLVGDNFECSQVFNRRLRRERGGRG
jgi:hypothetical protein